MLDDDHGIAQVAQPQQRVQQLPLVAVVQADGRLVEYVHDVDQPAAHLAGQPNPLRFSARQRRREPVQIQVMQTDIAQEGEPVADLLERVLGDQALCRRQRQPLEEGPGRVHVHRHHVGNRLPADGDRQTLRAQPLAAAVPAGRDPHRRLKLLHQRPRLQLPIALLKLGDDPLPDARMVPRPAGARVVEAEVDLLCSRTVQERVPVLGRQLPPGGLQLEAIVPGDAFEPLAPPVAPQRPHQRNGARQQGFPLVLDHQLGDELALVAHAVAGRAHATRAVEREMGVGRLLKTQLAPLARVAARKQQVGLPVGGDDDFAVGQLAGLIHRLRHARPHLGADGHAVHDDLYVVPAVAVQQGRFVQPRFLAIHPRPQIPPPGVVVEELLELPLAALDDRRQQTYLRAFRQAQGPPDDRLAGLAADLLMAAGAMRLADGRIQHAQVVIDLGHRRDGRTGVVAAGALVDRNRGRKPRDVPHGGFAQLLQELPGVRGKRLDIAPLPFGEKRVEGQ